jgi:hypothetical protein
MPAKTSTAHVLGAFRCDKARVGLYAAATLGETMLAAVGVRLRPNRSRPNLAHALAAVSV